MKATLDFWLWDTTKMHIEERSFIILIIVFWFACFVHDYQLCKRNLEHHKHKFNFVGYNVSQKKLMCCCTIEKKMFISMDVLFSEA